VYQGGVSRWQSHNANPETRSSDDWFQSGCTCGLQAMLTKDERLEVIGDAPNGYDALLYIKRLHDEVRLFTLLLTETRNGELDGVQATRIIKDEFPEISILVLTENLNDSYVIDAIHAGRGDISSSRI